MDKPILNHYDAYQMFQRITCASNEDIMLIKEMLVDRFKKYTDELAPEVPFIKKLKKVLDEYCTGKETSIKIVMLKEFSNDLDDILALYNNETYSYLLEEEDLLMRLDDI
jgi:ATP-dependent protease Clp ATPase subunit